MPSPDKIYFHGTETRNAYAIMTQGFKLGEISKGRRLGRGLYITTRPESAVFWSHFITIKCPSAPTYRTLNSKWERAEGGNIHRGGVLPLRSVAVSPTSTQSRLQSARSAPCRHRIDASPTKM